MTSPITGSELSFDASLNIANMLPVSDVLRLGQVSKFWQSMVQAPLVWENQSEKNYVPLVDGPHRDRKRDFKILFPMTFGPQQMGPLGKFHGKIPKITQEDFNRLLKNDRFEPGKKVAQTFRLIIEPEFIEREYDQELIDDLTNMGDFNTETNISKDNSKIFVPYSLVNVRILADYFPLTRKGTGVFCAFHPDVLTQCSAVANKVKIYFMRVEIPKETVGISANEQEKLIQQDGFEITRLSPRVLSDALDFLNHGENADSTSETGRRIFTRTADSIQQLGIEYPVIIGDFVSHIEENEIADDEPNENGFPADDGESGGFVGLGSRTPDDEVGAVPGWPSGNQKNSLLPSSKQGD